LAYTFSVVAWQDWNGRRYGGLPNNPQDARGLKVLMTNPDNPGDTHQYWNYSTIHFQDWSEWWVYIGALAVSHGLELADEPPPDDDYGEPPPEDDEAPEDEPRDFWKGGGVYRTEHPVRDFFVGIAKTVGKWFR